MKRILIIGPNGSGKTTLAARLSESTRLPVIHLDPLYWRDGWRSASDREFDELLQAELEKPEWIMDGNIGRTLEKRLASCDTVIFLDYGRATCLGGAVCRILQHYGKSRPDVGGHCPERFDRQKIAFLKSIWTSHRKNRERFLRMLGMEAGRVEVVRLKNRFEMNRYLNRINASEGDAS